jgi:hypothetical protein
MVVRVNEARKKRTERGVDAIERREFFAAAEFHQSLT